jgi:thymidylate synthase
MFNLLGVISKNYKMQGDDLPWSNSLYRDYFANKIKGGILLMGRKTWESIPVGQRTFEDSITVVLSNQYMKYQELGTDQLIFTNMFCVWNEIIPSNPNRDVWVVGGREVYASLLTQCKTLYLTVLEKSIKSQMDFPNIPEIYEITEYTEKRWVESEQCFYRNFKFVRNEASKSRDHEKQYLARMREILETGRGRDDRTGVGTIGLFGGQQRYDVSKYLPILTTKFVPIKLIIKELLWFLRGETDAKILQKQGVHIWDGNSSREFLDKRGLTHYEEGDIGPGYGMSMRHFGAKYEGCKADYTGKGFDQIQYILDLLKNDPFSRRIYMSNWNPSELANMALPPCHVSFQLYVEEDDKGERHLSGHLYQRSSDYFLAANYNLVSYTILLYILAKMTGYKPKDMFMSFGDVHIYKNHIEQANQQLMRHPRPQPILLLSDTIKDKSIDDITVEDFELLCYLHHPAIQAAMAV